MRATADALWALLVAALIAFAAHACLGLGGHGLDGLFNNWIYNALMVGAGASIVLSGFRHRGGRAIWLVLGGGVLAWAAGEIYFTLALADMDTPPVPSPADAMYLAIYPASYVALMRFMRMRVAHLRTSLWLDGLIGGFSAAAIGTSLVLGPILAGTEGTAAQVATNLAYPLGDVLLLILTISALGLTGWRLDRTLLAIALGFGCSAAADTLYLFKVANETYREGTFLDALWPVAMMLLAYASRRPPARRELPGAPDARTSWVPAAGLFSALALLVWDHFHRLNTVSLWLATAAIFVALLRMALSLRESARAVAALSRRAETDPLTGLLNHRSFQERLAAELDAAGESRTLALLAIDVDNFKGLNDTYGHSVGDDALRDVAETLQAAVRPDDVLGRVGGDEFMLILPDTDDAGAERSAARLREAVSASRAALTVSIGIALYPTHTTERAALMRFADGAMYWSKRDGRDRHSIYSPLLHEALSADEEIDMVRRDGLLRTVYSLAAAVDAKDGYTSAHSRRVASYVATLGAALGIEGEHLNLLKTAGALHDVGKIGIPEAILFKAGALDPDEYAEMQRHSSLGREIIRGAGLHEVAEWVLHLHERYDGAGYPDGIAAGEIPFESRMLAVADAFEALTSARIYREGVLPAEAALHELERCGGTHFDPVVVAQFARLVRDGAIRPLEAQPLEHLPAPPLDFTLA